MPILTIPEAEGRPETGITVRFRPEAWVRDVAVEVDGEGPTEWVVALDELDDADAEFLERGVVSDETALRSRHAPLWVAQWRGPFSCHVIAEAPFEAALAFWRTHKSAVAHVLLRKSAVGQIDRALVSRAAEDRDAVVTTGGGEGRTAAVISGKILRVLDASTGHLREETRRALDSNECAARVGRAPAMASPHGWLISTARIAAEPEDLAGVPDDLAVMIRYAREAGCEYILFDCDADRIEDLPCYD